MASELLIPPLFGYALLAIGLALCTFLFLTLKQDMRRTEKRGVRQQQQLEASIQELRAQLAGLRTVLKDVEERAGALPQLSPPRPGMNLSRRGQVLRMHRRGERPEQIAAALSLPLNEVELLLKVHQAVHAG